MNFIGSIVGSIKTGLQVETVVQAAKFLAGKVGGVFAARASEGNEADLLKQNNLLLQVGARNEEERAAERRHIAQKIDQIEKRIDELDSSIHSVKNYLMISGVAMGSIGCYVVFMHSRRAGL